MIRSLRWRLQVWHAAILFLAISGFGAVLHSSVRQLRINEIDSDLIAAARVLEGSLRGVPRDILGGGVDRAQGDRPLPDRPPHDHFPPGRPPPEGRPPGGRGPPPPRGQRLPDLGYPLPDSDPQLDPR
ncbi:MAG TPA: hypothetical protein VGM05_09215, partial [Planctomycetaceae bacterium]